VVLTAVEVLVLWRGGDAEAAEAGFWPLFVLVVDEHTDPDGVAWLTAHLKDGGCGTPTAPGECRWSAPEDEDEYFVLSVTAPGPLADDLQILVPVQCFLGISGLFVRGAAVAVSTRRHARRLATITGGTRTLDHVLPLGSRTTGRLSQLAGLLGCRGVGRNPQSGRGTA
jgi:hypothetical protein